MHLKKENRRITNQVIFCPHALWYKGFAAFVQFVQV